jgi:hypothetical protein
MQLLNLVSIGKTIKERSIKFVDIGNPVFFVVKF